MFSWQEQYLTRSLRSLVRYCCCHSNIKFISSRHRVISSIYLFKITNIFNINLFKNITLDPRLSTFDPRPSALDPRYVTLGPRPSTLDKNLHSHHVKEAMNMRGKLTSLINYRYMIVFRANNRQRVIGAFCNFHVNSKQSETNKVRVLSSR